MTSIKSLKPLILSGSCLISPLSFGADILPVDSIRTPLASGKSSIFLDYEQREKIKPRPVDEEDVYFTSQVMILGAQFGMPYGWNLGLNLKNVKTSALDEKTDDGFAGGRLVIEKGFKLSDHFRYSLGLFAESGAGAEDANNIIGRSKAVKKGWIARLFVGSGDLRGDVLVGQRLRKEEETWGYSFSRELLYGAGIEMNFGKAFNLFARYSGRTIALSEIVTDLKGDYKVSDAKAGIGFTVSSVHLSFYGGKSLGQDGAYATGSTILGAGLRVDLGATEKVRSKSKKGKNNKKKTPRSRGDDILADLEAVTRGGKGKPEKEIGTVMDDFQLVDKKLKESGLRESLQTEEELANEEIRRLKEVEAKQKKFKKKSVSLEEKTRRQKIKDELRMERKNEMELRKELKDEVDGLPIITDEETSWKGLED